MTLKKSHTRKDSMFSELPSMSDVNKRKFKQPKQKRNIR